jgi:hypothetical protein
MGVMMDDDNAAVPKKSALPIRLKIWMGASLVAILWGCTFYLVVAALREGVPPLTKTNSLADIATLAFGTSGVALAVFSLLVGGAAIAGWQQLKQGVRNEVEEAMQERIVNLEKELRARVLASIGMVLGLFYARMDPEQNLDTQKLREERADYLAEVVQHCLSAYKMFKELPGTGKYMALNNLVYFASIQGEMSTRSFILEKARELRTVAEERNFWEGLLTYCLAVLQFSSDLVEVGGAQSLASELAGKRELTDRQKREAATTATSLANKLLHLQT